VTAKRPPVCEFFPWARGDAAFYLKLFEHGPNDREKPSAGMIVIVHDEGEKIQPFHGFIKAVLRTKLGPMATHGLRRDPQDICIRTLGRRAAISIDLIDKPGFAQPSSALTFASVALLTGKQREQHVQRKGSAVSPGEAEQHGVHASILLTIGREAVRCGGRFAKPSRLILTP
jgi:hypothetical protein